MKYTLEYSVMAPLLGVICDLSQHLARMHKSGNPRVEMQMDPLIMASNDLLEVFFFPILKTLGSF